MHSFMLCVVLSTIGTMHNQFKQIENQVLSNGFNIAQSFDNNRNWNFADS
jgi:hypothetical protein